MARKIDWESALTEDDILWLRNSGQPGIEERIRMHQEQYGGEVPDPETGDDLLTASALDASARASVPVEDEGSSGPRRVDPTEADPQTEDTEDDYDSWKVSELEDEVAARNEMEGTSQVTVEGTGKDGAVRKADLVKGLRVWDQENPGALDAKD